MDKIDIMIIGAQKAGTTSLKKLLSKHPDIITHFPQEFVFFSKKDNHRNIDFTEAFNHCFPKEVQNSKIKILAKNATIYSNPTAIESLYNHNPSCKIIFSVRNPVKRAFSSYKMENFYGWAKKDFNEIVKNDIKKYLHSNEKVNGNDDASLYFKIFIEWGQYSVFLKKIYDFFPKEQVLIVQFDNFVKDPFKKVSKIFHWAGLKNMQEFPDYNEIHNQSFKPKSFFFSNILTSLKSEENIIKQLIKKTLPYGSYLFLGKMLENLNKTNKPYAPPDNETLQILAEYYRPFNKEFETLTGIDVSSWNDWERNKNQHKPQS